MSDAPYRGFRAWIRASDGPQVPYLAHVRTKAEAREAVLRRRGVASDAEVDVDDDDVTDRVLALKIPKGEAFDE